MTPRLALVGALSCLIACSEADIEQRTERIIDGEASGASDDGVVMLRTELDDSEILCSGTLVAKNLVITARHCVSYLSQGLFNCTVEGELIDNPTGGGTLGQHLPAETITVFDNVTPRTEPLARGQRVISTLAPAICVNDLAFVVLDAELDLPIVPLRLDAPALAGEDVTLVGYGLIDDRQDLTYRTQSRQRKAGLEIAGVGPDSIEDGVTTVPPRSLILKGPSGCIGDSGGPLLASATGALLGVYSLQAGESCVESGVRHQLVHVPPFRVLLEEAFEAAGATPLGEQTGGGEGGAAGAAASNTAGASEPEPQEEDDDLEGSGCHVSRATPSSALGAWLGLLGLAALLRRRRA